MALAGWLGAIACGPAASSGAPRAPGPTPGGKAPAATPATAPTSAPSASPASPRRGTATLLYGPAGVAAYAYQRRDSLILELPGATQVQTLDRTAYLRVSVAEGPGRYRATIVLDSLRAVPGTPIPEDSLRAADGTQWTAALAPSGQLSDLQANRTTVAGEQIGSTLQALFPPLPPGGAAAGAEWIDTTNTKVRTTAFEAQEAAVTSYRAAGSEVHAGQQALRVESRGTFQRVGTGLQFGQEMEMSASGSRRGVHHVGLAGALVAAEGSDSSDMSINVPAVGQSVPVKQFSTYTITGLPQRSR